MILLTLFIFTIDIRRFLESFSEANYLLVGPAAGVYLISVLFRTLRWKILINHLKPVSVVRLYPVVVVGYMANNILPMRIGELVRSYYLSERENISKTTALVTILIERLLDALTLLTFIAVAAFFIPVLGIAQGFGELSNLPWLVLLIGLTLPFVVGFIALMLISLTLDGIKRRADFVVRHLPNKLSSRGYKSIDMVLSGLIPLNNPKILVRLFLLSIPVWLFEALLFTLIGFSFHLELAFENMAEMLATMLFVTAVANIGASVPAAPGGIGLFEFIARETLVLIPLATLDRAEAGAYITIVHATLLIPMIVLGQVFLWTQNISFGSLSRAANSAPSTGSPCPKNPQYSKINSLCHRGDHL